MNSQFILDRDVNDWTLNGDYFRVMKKKLFQPLPQQILTLQKHIKFQLIKKMAHLWKDRRDGDGNTSVDKENAAYQRSNPDNKLDNNLS